MKRFGAWFILCALLCCVLASPLTAAASRDLRIGFNPHLPPYQFVDGAGIPQGLHIDLLRAISDNYGYAFSYHAYETNQACLDALKNGDIDLIVGVITDSIKNEPDLRYTTSLTSSQLCMMVEADNALRDERITTAIFASDSIQHTVLAHLGVHKFIAVGDQQMVYERQKEHPGSAMIGIRDSLLYQLNQDGRSRDYEIRHNYLNTIDFVMAVRADHSELLRAMNESISRLKAGQTYETLSNQWLPQQEPDLSMQKTLRRLLLGVVLILSIVLAYSVIMRRLQKVLKRRVAAQTEQIQATNVELERQFSLLKDENDLRNRIIKYSPSGMLLFDRDYTITMMNKSAYAMAGVFKSSIGDSALSVPVFGDILRRQGNSVFAPGSQVANESIRLEKATSSRTYNYMMYQIYRYGEVAGVLLSVQDMTRLERMQQAEFEKEKNLALTRIAAGIAHEIRNPLMTIRTFASLLDIKADDKEVQASFARFVPQEVDRINRLIENLIHYAVPAKRRVERIALSQVVEDCLALVHPVIKRTAIVLETEITPGIHILADRDQISQVLVNIFFNSIEAMEKKLEGAPTAQPVLSVRVLHDMNQVAVYIRDEGIGMTAKELALCRTPFFSTKEKGTGLGLALCEQYIKENNGTFSIDSVKHEYTVISLYFERN